MWLWKIATEKLNKFFAVTSRDRRIAGVQLGYRGHLDAHTLDAALPLLILLVEVGGSRDSFCQNDRKWY